MIVKMFSAYDDHCIIYSGFIGIILNLAFGPNVDPVSAFFIFAFLGGLFWYAGKAVLITGGTVKRCIETGEPMIKAGGLTEYDTEFAKQIGEAAEAARRRNEGR